MRKVIEQDLGEPVSSAFADFDPEPIAAASIGQVYRATLHDGREVAVKVQYPGIGDAVRADMKNLGVLLRLARSITPELDTKAVGDEIRERIVEELDYELEASNQRTMARIYDGHPFIAIPAVITLALPRAGDRHRVRRRRAASTRCAAAPSAERDRIGEILFRFYFGSMYRYRRFSGDPHPGNMLGLADGRIAFLDFGLFKSIDRDVAALELACQRATIDGDAEELHRLMSDAGFLPRGDRDRCRRADRVRPRRDLVVHDRRVDPDRPDDRQPRLHPDDRRALQPLQDGPPPGHRPRAPLRSPARAADPRRPRPARVRGELVPDRLRMDLRRRAARPSSAARRPPGWRRAPNPRTGGSPWLRPARSAARAPTRTPTRRSVAKPSRSCAAPRSAATEVIRAASIPHGTTQSNGCRSLLTLTARPWVETPRLTWIPIEPIFRASRAAAASAGSQAADDRPLRARGTLGDRRPSRRPDPGQAAEDLGGDAVVGERGDHHPLEQLRPRHGRRRCDRRRAR